MSPSAGEPKTHFATVSSATLWPAAAGAVGVWDWNFETNELYVDPDLKAILGFDDGRFNPAGRLGIASPS